MLDVTVGAPVPFLTKPGRTRRGSDPASRSSGFQWEQYAGSLGEVFHPAVGAPGFDERQDDDDWSKFWFRVPRQLTRQMASKGSVAVDGISLTLVDVEDERFSVALIPHTLQVTTLGTLQAGGEVNIETDLLAKYVERQLAGGSV